MIVNNFKQIADFLTFESEDDFYHLQILKRKKDCPEHEKGRNNNARCIRTYYIKNVDYFLRKEEEIMNTTLFIMAAGIGSRFGTGIKQLEPVDDAGHIIMDTRFMMRLKLVSIM